MNQSSELSPPQDERICPGGGFFYFYLRGLKNEVPKMPA
jgi:hypothetical protein